MEEYNNKNKDNKCPNSNDTNNAINNSTSIIIERYINILQCPNCSGDLKLYGNYLKCVSCNKIYKIINGIPILLKGC